MRLRRVLITAVLAASVTLGSASGALAKGGGGGGTTPPPGTPCATLAITNNGQTVRNLSMPDLRYNLENCGSAPLAATVTFSEAPGFLSTICPAPTAPPASVTLAVKQKVSATAPVYRGACGEVSPSNQTVIWSTNAWQGHNVLVTVTDDATGSVLASAWFSWQDAAPRV